MESDNRIRRAVLAVLLLLGYCPATSAFTQLDTVKGIVFSDNNRNGVRDAGEPGLRGVAVSNQLEVVQTDAQGRYTLPVGEQAIIFITKPSGYDVPLNEDNLPQFYYIPQPEGSPSGLDFPGIAPTGPLPQSVDFPLIKAHTNGRFKAIVTGDPQPRNAMEVSYYRDDIVTEMMAHEATFYIALGDIAYDDLSVYARLNQATAQLGIPVYNVHGNHDMNFRASDDRLAAETFKRIFGPTYYSFEYGKVHFVVLDDVEYEGWDATNNRRGQYRGFLSQQQLRWLHNDLALVPEDYLVVLTMHIPIASEISDEPQHSIANRQALFEILQNRKHLLALSGHYHVIEHLEFSAEMGWKGTTPFPGISTGAGCGAWWSGPPDSRGIPESLCMDGTPNGFFVFTFDDNQFSYQFYPANHSADFQIRISFPVGTLAPDSLKNSRIIANVFNGNSRTRVQYALDGGENLRMQQTRMKDPFMLEYLSRYRDFIPDWIQDVPETNHIWTAPLPGNLAPGTHRLQVTARDAFGNVYESVRLFEVAPPVQADK